MADTVNSGQEVTVRQKLITGCLVAALMNQLSKKCAGRKIHNGTQHFFFENHIKVKLTLKMSRNDSHLKCAIIFFITETLKYFFFTTLLPLVEWKNYMSCNTGFK